MKCEKCGHEPGYAHEILRGTPDADGTYCIALHSDGTSTDMNAPYCRECGSNKVELSHQVGRSYEDGVRAGIELAKNAVAGSDALENTFEHVKAISEAADSSNAIFRDKENGNG